MEQCPVCKTARKPSSAFCVSCGYHFDERHCVNCNCVIEPQAVFCPQCGYKPPEAATGFTTESKPDFQPMVRPPMEVIRQEPIPQGQMNQFDQPYNYRPKRSKKGLIIGVSSVIVVILIAVLAIQFLGSRQSQTSGAVPPAVKVEKKEAAPPKFSYEAVSVIRPALYQSIDNVVHFKGSSEEEKEMLLTVEIPGFTQKYEQKIILKPQEVSMNIHPPLIQGVLKTLNISKDTQLKVSLQDVATQKYLIQDSKPVKVLSKYDMKWVSDDGSETYYQNICAWVTPESPKIKELLRNSIDQLSIWSKGSINAIVGYQHVGDMSGDNSTYYQIAAIYETLRSYYQVRYTATPVSTSGKEAQQRIALPEDVINQQSGLCIETAVTMASAIEATGMHAMILILPGHAQVACESWSEVGEYFLIETTALTEPDWDNIIAYPTKEEWNNYLTNNQVTVIDVDSARKDGIKPME